MTLPAVERLVLISSDTHCGGAVYDYRPYLDSRWHEEFDQWARNFSPPTGLTIVNEHAPESLNWDSDARLALMDEQGITGEVLFPNTTPPFFENGIVFPPPRTKDEFERRFAGLQAHNRWIADFCGLAPERRRGIFQIFPNDIDLAIDEVRRVTERDRLGVMGGVLLPAIAPDDPVEPYFHPRYEALWSVCEELGVPVHQHLGTGIPSAGMDAPAFGAVLAHEISDWLRRTLTHLVLAGVFERHPKLKFVITESIGIRRIAEDIQWMDMRIPQLKRTNKPALPSYDLTSLSGSSPGGSDLIDGLTSTAREYFQQNCYLGASQLPRRDVPFLAELGFGRVMWGSDFPHGEGVTPYTLEALRATLWDVPVESLRLLLGMVATDVYRFDVQRVKDIANTIGPTVIDVQKPFDLRDRPLGSFAFLMEEADGTLH
jgi:predicted TIM-barrel fold metal-dependent hydrolase